MPIARSPQTLSPPLLCTSNSCGAVLERMADAAWRPTKGDSIHVTPMEEHPLNPMVMIVAQVAGSVRHSHAQPASRTGCELIFPNGPTGSAYRNLINYSLIG